jgi:hypothetical protein
MSTPASAEIELIKQLRILKFLLWFVPSLWVSEGACIAGLSTGPRIKSWLLKEARSVFRP